MISSLRVPQLTAFENETANRLIDKLNRLSVRNRLRSSFYDGRRAVEQVGSVIPPQYLRIAMVLGWTAKGVDGLARRCNLHRFAWPDGDLDSLGMRDLADSNFLFSELAQARTDSLLHGVSYLITSQGGAGEPRALVHVRDALHATGEWNPRTRRLDNLISITGLADDGTVESFNLYFHGLTVTAVRSSGGVWSVDRSQHFWGMPAEPLVYRPRVSRPMGRSRITRPAMAIQDAALRAMVRLEAHMDIYAIPKLMLLGADESIFKNADGTVKATWQVVMGRVFGIPDDEDADPNLARVEVKQLSAESPQPHLAQLNALAKLAAREFDLPDSDFALTDLANPTSADAYTTSRENLIAEAEGTQNDWSVPLRRTVTRALAIQNGERGIPDSWSSIVPDWQSPMYMSRAAEADAGAKEIGAVPWLAETRVGLRRMGFSELEIDEALAERRANAGRNAAAAIIAARTPVTNDEPAGS